MTRSNGAGLKIPEKKYQVAHILIAEDDDDFRMILMRRVKRMGHRIVGVEDGTQAIQAIKKDEFELLIVDLNMPGENGLDVIKTAQHFDPNIQVIVVTGEGSVESAIEALRYRVFDFLTKPLESLLSFEIIVRQALDQAYQNRKKHHQIVEFQRMAVMDPLTGLYNRNKLNEELEREIQRGKRLLQSLSLIMLDIDYLKSINDTHGHSFGDVALCQVADVIQSESRKTDIPVRLGGDEFLIVLPNTGIKDAAAVAERIQEKISGLDINGDPISVSIGVGEWSETYKTDDDFIHAVDQALYQSKENAETCITIK